MRIAVSPEYREDHDLSDLEARAEALDVIVGTHHLRGEWRVRVRRGMKVLTLRGKGALDAIVTAALDDFTEQHGEPWTPEELVQIASQSGIEVHRA